MVLWEIDLTVQGGERYFFCNELNEKREPVTWQGRQYQAYPIEGSGFEMNGKGSSARLNRPGFPGECFICELRLPDHRFRWKH
ncbi:phage minor tail protein L, partial [Escherichia coli MA6]